MTGPRFQDMTLSEIYEYAGQAFVNVTKRDDFPVLGHFLDTIDRLPAYPAVVARYLILNFAFTTDEEIPEEFDENDVPEILSNSDLIFKYSVVAIIPSNVWSVFLVSGMATVVLEIASKAFPEVSDVICDALAPYNTFGKVLRLDGELRDKNEASDNG